MNPRRLTARPVARTRSYIRPPSCLILLGRQVASPRQQGPGCSRLHVREERGLARAVHCFAAVTDGPLRMTTMGNALHSPVRYPARGGERGAKPSDRLRTFRLNDVQPAYSHQSSFFNGALPFAHVLPLATVP
jgi:hypothetical protein